MIAAGPGCGYQFRIESDPVINNAINQNGAPLDLDFVFLPGKVADSNDDMKQLAAGEIKADQWFTERETTFRSALPYVHSFCEKAVAEKLELNHLGPPIRGSSVETAAQVKKLAGGIRIRHEKPTDGKSVILVYARFLAKITPETPKGVLPLPPIRFKSAWEPPGRKALLRIQTNSVKWEKAE